MHSSSIIAQHHRLFNPSSIMSHGLLKVELLLFFSRKRGKFFAIPPHPFFRTTLPSLHRGEAGCGVAKRDFKLALHHESVTFVVGEFWEQVGKGDSLLGRS
jgi:hypothetical protein